jgi:DNA-binding Lrp family transcriptional regulator
MSVEVISWVFRHSPESTPGRRLVLIVLADKADHDGTGAYPSVATIAREARMSERGVRYALRALEESGQIERRGLHPVYGTNEYAVNMGQPVQGGKPTQEGGQTDADQVSQIAPEPSLEPSGTVKREERARAKADEVPDDFPENLRPHARIVYPLLRDVAEQHNARPVTARAVALTIMGNPGRRYVSEAHAFAAWAQAPPRPVKDVVGSYRTWLKRAEQFAGVEPLSEASPNGLPANVAPLRRRNGRSTAADYQNLKGRLG